ncbi:MAG: hypothetical protein GW949_00255 [Spirochaetales bacterium]|nr:hypothetical protein [Spirochaetales bacterium]
MAPAAYSTGSLDPMEDFGKVSARKPFLGYNFIYYDLPSLGWQKRGEGVPKHTIVLPPGAGGRRTLTVVIDYRFDFATIPLQE